jgi:hypothetical protein
MSAFTRIKVIRKDDNILMTEAPADSRAQQVLYLKPLSIRSSRGPCTDDSLLK